jgi:signal transduction histidine kinase
MAWTKSADPSTYLADGGRRDRRTGALRGSRSEAGWSEVLAKVSHDIRTPLNAVIGFADLMQRELHGSIGNERYREYVNHIRDCGADLLQAAEETLLMTVLLGAPETLSKETANLAVLVATTVEALGDDLARKSTDIDTNIPADSNVLVDRRAVRLALKHLLKCAVALAPPHAAILLHVTAEHGIARLDITIDSARGDVAAAARGPQSGFDAEVLLARALLRLQGAELIEGEEISAPLFSVLFETASQADFFSGH